MLKKGNSQKNKNIHENTRKPLWLTLLLGLLFLLLLLGGAAALYANHLFEKMGTAADFTYSADTFVEETDAGLLENPEVETLSPEEVTLHLADRVMKDKDVVNILLIGQDTQDHVEGTRSDSMILATINQKEKTITVTSFMRDLYVDIPGYQKSRINSAYTLGGPKLLDETIETNFGIHIDGNIAIDFAGFSACVDELGGVDIELTPKEAASINKEVFKSQPSIINAYDLRADRYALTGGVEHLNGEKALQYARLREIDSDFNRTKRQRTLLNALFQKAISCDLKTATGLLEQALPLITTDLTRTRLLGYMAGILTMQPITFETDRIPADGTFREAVIHRMQVLIPDLKLNQQHLRRTLYGSEESSGGVMAGEAEAKDIGAAEKAGQNPKTGSDPAYEDGLSYGFHNSAAAAYLKSAP